MRSAWRSVSTTFLVGIGVLSSYSRFGRSWHNMPSPPDCLKPKFRGTLLVAELHEQASPECAASSSISRRYVAVAPNKNIENDPMQGSRQSPARMRFGQYLTRRANQRHSFIIAQSVRHP